MPFIMMFMVIFFFLQHAEEIHSKKSLTSRYVRRLHILPVPSLCAFALS